jgi:hypothetical protein
MIFSVLLVSHIAAARGGGVLLIVSIVSSAPKKILLIILWLDFVANLFRHKYGRWGYLESHEYRMYNTYGKLFINYPNNNPTRVQPLFCYKINIMDKKVP